MAASCSPILWQNEDQTVSLVDIPRSISAAQGTPEKPCSDLLISCEPRTEPYSSHEPKTARAKSSIKHNTVEESRHAEYRLTLESALDEVRKQHDHDWCLPRHFVAGSDVTQRPEKRKLDDMTGELVEQETKASAIAAGHNHEEDLPNSTRTCSEGFRSEKYECPFCYENDPQIHTNCGPDHLESRVSSFHLEDANCSSTFRMPPFSSLCLGDMGQSSIVRSFHNAVRSQASAHDVPRQFNLVLLDPPWPNRSVDRARGRTKSGYATASSLRNVGQLIVGMDLDLLMADDALVGIWITNKQAIRDLVLDEIFPQWGVHLEEEWIWLKTTAHGEPISALDSAWRKPYEVLMLGRKRQTGLNTTDEQSAPKRRAIFAVPDLHSRKPCLKVLLEPLLPVEYRALEVFSRHLVAGWWSIGNECTKFNEESNWYKAAGTPATMIDQHT